MERGIFIRQAYYDEAEGRRPRDIIDIDGGRTFRWLCARRRNARRRAVPEKDAGGKAISYAGDLTMFGGSVVRTLFGGDIELMVAGGQTLVGVGGILHRRRPPGILSIGLGRY